MGEAERVDLNALASTLAPSEILEVADFIAWKVARHESALQAALAWHEALPPEVEDVSQEEEMAVSASKADLTAGGKAISLEDLARELEL